MMRKVYIITVVAVILVGCGIFYFFLTRSFVSNFVSLNYNQEENGLLITNMDSGTYFHEIDLDSKQDTLFINVHKKLILKSTDRITTNADWKIRLAPQYNIKYVKLDDEIINIHEIKPITKERLSSCYALIEMFPQIIPCEIRF